MRHRLSARLAVAIVPFLLVAVVAGCSSTPSAPTTTSAPATTSSSNTRPECAAIGTAAKDLGSALTALLGGQGSREQALAASQQLASALSSARATLGPEARASLDAASAAVQQLLTALQTQPVDLAAVRSAAGQATAAAGQVLAVCSASSSSPAPSSPPTLTPTS